MVMKVSNACFWLGKSFSWMAYLDYCVKKHESAFVKHSFSDTVSLSEKGM